MPDQTTPEQPKIEVVHEGQKITVDLPQGYLSQEQVDSEYLNREAVKENYVLKQQFNDRFKNWTSLKDAATNEQVIAAVLKDHGTKGDTDLETAKAKWTETEYDPLNQRFSKIQSQLIRSEIARAGANLFDDRFISRPAPDKPSYVESLFGDRLKYNEDLGYVAVVDKDGNFVPSAKPTAGAPYATAAEFFAEQLASEEFKNLAKPQVKNNDTGYRPPSQGSNKSGQFRRSDYPEYRSQMTAEQKSALISAIGYKGFMQIPEKPNS